VQLWHSPARTHATFDDPNLVSRAGLVPVMALAEPCGLSALVRQKVTITAKTGVNADLKAPCLIAGMAAGADSIDDMDLLRHGAMSTLSYGIRAPNSAYRRSSAEPSCFTHRCALSRFRAAGPAGQGQRGNPLRPLFGVSVTWRSRRTGLLRVFRTVNWC
jgi:hypothetical protein